MSNYRTLQQVTDDGPTTSNKITANGFDANTHTIDNVTDPSTAQQAATKNYTDAAIAAAIAGGNSAVEVQAATAAVLPNTPTYNNGVAGVGATLTAAVTNVALVIDGVTPTLGQRVLVKNQASSFQNGIYTVTQIASLGLAWILTRSLDYNQPSNINNTGVIPVVNGTVNASTGWIITTTVTTVGTDAITYTQFVYSTQPATKGGTGQTTYALGDTLYSDATNSLAKLSGNTTATKKFLSQTGTGTVSAAPSWLQPATTDLSDVTATTDFSGTIAVGNVTTLVVSYARYSVIGNIVFCSVLFSGTATATAAITFTLPVAGANLGSDQRSSMTRITNNTSGAATVKITNNSTAATIYASSADGSFTAGNNVSMWGNFFYFK